MKEVKIDLNKCVKLVDKHNSTVDKKDINQDEADGINNRRVSLSEVVSAKLLVQMKKEDSV